MVTLIEHKSMLQPSRTVRETKSEEGAVLLDIEQGVCFSLNSLGCKIWELIAQGNDIDHIVAELEKTYPISKARLTHDVEEFIGDLQSRKLLISSTSSSHFLQKQHFFTRWWEKYFSKPRDSKSNPARH